MSDVQSEFITCYFLIAIVIVSWLFITGYIGMGELLFAAGVTLALYAWR